MRRMFTKQQKEEMIEYYISHTQKELRDKYKIDSNVVAKWVRQTGLPSKAIHDNLVRQQTIETLKANCVRNKCTHITPELKAEIIEFYKTHTLKEVTAKYNIGTVTINNWIHPESKKRNYETTKNWAQNNPDKRKAFIQKRTAKVRELKKSDPEYQEAYNDYLKIYYKDNYNNNPEYKRNMFERHIISNRKRRAMKRGVKENYTKEDDTYTRQLFDHKCAVCGRKDRLEIDHWFPLDKGYALTRQNAVLMCESCNCSKGNKMPSECYDKDFIMLVESKLK